MALRMPTQNAAHESAKRHDFVDSYSEKQPSPATRQMSAASRGACANSSTNRARSLSSRRT